MHEMGIANSVLEAVRTEAKRHPLSRVLTVGLTVGGHAGVDTESLRFCFDALKKDTDLDKAELVIDYQPESLELLLSHLELEEECPT